jgi:hypothetical protein
MRLDAPDGLLMHAELKVGPEELQRRMQKMFEGGAPC